MNERIQKFAEQAGFNFRVDCATDDEMVRIYQTADKVEKLAELIVRECIEQIEKNVVGAIGTYASAYNSAVLKCKKSIQEHFEIN